MKIVEHRFGKYTAHEPQECYFAVVEPNMEDYPPVLIFISDKETWDKNKYTGDVKFEDGILPEEFVEWVESVYESNSTSQEIKEALLKVGFTYCQEMESCIEEYN